MKSSRPLPRIAANPYKTGCVDDSSVAFDVRADGRVAVGLVWHGCNPEAFRRTDGTNGATTKVLEIVGMAPAGAQRTPTNRATVVSDDGKVSAGFAAERAAKTFLLRLAPGALTGP